MAKNLDKINSIKHQDREVFKRHSSAQKERREHLMSMSLEKYESICHYYNADMTFQLTLEWMRSRNLITKEEEESINSMRNSPLSEDKVMGFAILKQKYKDYKNRFKRKPR